jgi:hypothetical protein
MRPYWIIGLCATLLAGVAGAAEKAEDAWKTYRNDQFGYEISYPPDMAYKAYVDGLSGELKDARTGHALVQFDVWPPGECPRQPAGVLGRELGIERAKAATQADGPDGSSYCGDPVTVREYQSLHGAKIYELELTCVRETYPESHDDTVDTEPDDATIQAQPVVTPEGTKGPTYFVDISPSWSKRILSADPVGVDPRLRPTQAAIDLSVLRAILGTLKTFPIPRPSGICIEDLQNRGLTIGVPRR